LSRNAKNLGGERRDRVELQKISPPTLDLACSLMKNASPTLDLVF